MATGNLDSADMKAAAFKGTINESVIQEYYDVSYIPHEFMSRIGVQSVGNSYAEWGVDDLGAQDLDNAKVDGADTINENDASVGGREGNHCQISTKTVKVSTRARNSDALATSDEYDRQMIRSMQKLERDREGIYLTGQGSEADDGNSTPGRLGGLQAWLKSNAVNGTTAGFANGQVPAFTPGEAKAASFRDLKALINHVWTGGGNPSLLMSVPSVISGLNEYMLDPSNNAPIAALSGNTSADSGRNQMVAKGSVNVFVSDFGQVLEIVANRLQPTYDDATAGTPLESAAMFVLDPDYIDEGILHGYREEELSKTGLADNSHLAIDYTLLVTNEKAHGCYNDIDVSAAWGD